MACCGQKRASLNLTGTLQASANKAGAKSKYTVFEYTGDRAMSVTTGSGSRYRFSAPGAKLQVDPRDVASLQALPHLRRIA